jgi:DNA-binding CsgD family transcriptional regulator
VASLEAGPEEEASLALVVVADDGRCVHASPEACTLLGATREQVLAARLVDLLAEDERDLFEHIWKAFRRGGGRAGPFRIDGPGRIEVDVDISSELLPSRHLVLLTAAGKRRPAESDSGRRVERRAGRAPSAREREVLALLAAGATDEEVASELEVSITTVRTHVRNAKAKLGAQTRVQAVALALRERLIRLA